jgi:hypothetical protein
MIGRTLWLSYVYWIEMFISVGYDTTFNNHVYILEVRNLMSKGAQIVTRVRKFTRGD